MLKVSIILVTYNSENYVLEALNGIQLQTYPYLELIVTDDHSGDKTVEVCRSWLESHSNRFIRTELLTSESNTGIPANCNRGLRNATGDWIKFCAADDMLLPGCIHENVEYISSHTDIKVLFSKVDVYNDSFTSSNFLKTIPIDPFNEDSILAPGRGALSQYKLLLTSDRIPFTPSVFLHRNTLLAINGFDERFRILEDHPLWLNLTKNGYRLSFMDKKTVCYRKHSHSVYNTTTKFLINPYFFLLEDFRKEYTYPFLPADLRLSSRYYWYSVQLFRIKQLNRDTRFNRILLSVLTLYLNPFRYFLYIRKLINKGLSKDEFYR